jgi:2-iminobutanoate/2-iminopropanoate deaminase
MKTISTPNAPAPAGHYSQAMVHNGIVYVSGQLPINPENGEKITGPIEAQTEQALKNLKAILEAANSDLNHVLKVNIYISNISLWGGVNNVYAEFFKDHKPARAVIPSRDLHYGFLLEVEAVAAVKS